MPQTFFRVTVLLAFVVSGCSRGSSPLNPSAVPLAPTASAGASATTCRTIENNTDTLTLKQNLSGPDPFCLRLVGGSGELDCQGYDVQGLDLFDVHGLTVRNCRMSALVATRSSEVTFYNNVITADTGKSVGAAVRFTNGTNNRIIRNTIDGGWRGQPYPRGSFPPGADDGIILDNEGNMLIEGNDIHDVWDCGIERVGNRTDPVIIRNNEITHAGYCGIGSWFAAGWRDSVIADNTVTNSGMFAQLYFSPTQNKGVDHITLRNNVIENNRFRNPLTPGTPSVSIDYVSGPKLPLDIGNNIFRNNDFGSEIPAPRLLPASGFVDGGANVCRQDGKSSLSCVR